MNQSWQYQKYGDERVLAYQPHNLPRLKRDELLVQVAAVSVNPVDWKIMAGQQKIFTGWRLSRPRIFGSDFSGTIVATGDPKLAHQQGYSLGQPVFGMVNPLSDGSFQDQLVLNFKQCCVLPPTFSMQEAAGLAACGCTLWRALKPRPDNFWQGKKVFINAAAGGVGHLLVQYLAKHGAKLIACASQQRFELLRQWGATECIDYADDAGITATAPWDCLIDCHGSFLDMDIGQFLKPGGLYIPISIPNQKIPATIVKSIGLRLKYGIFTRLVLARPSQFILKQVAELAQVKAYTVHIGALFTKQAVPQAVAQSIAGHTPGKIIIDFEQ